MLPGLPRNTSFRLNPILVGFVHISSSWVEISLHTEFQLPRLPGSRTVSFRLNPIFFLIVQLPRLPGSGSSMVVETTTTKKLGKIRGFLSPS